jgi:hypothetical protein
MAEPKITITVGHYTQEEPWTDVRVLTWSGLTEFLTRHEAGGKHGTCVVPAVFTPSVGKSKWNKGKEGIWRVKAYATQIDATFLDADSGHTLEEICSALETQGCAGIVSSTHSHLTTQTTVSESVWNKSEDPEAILAEKGYLPHVCKGAKMVGIVGGDALIEHAPCPKFRIVIPLGKPWRSEDFASQEEANAAWKGRIEALAHALGIKHDQSCVDTSRLFYLPRCRDLSQAETARVIGHECDIWSLPDAPNKEPAKGGKRPGLNLGNPANVAFTDNKTGEVVDLMSWCDKYGSRFQIAQALHARTPSAFVGLDASGKEHIDCPNRDEHSQQGSDKATFVIDASKAENAGFVIHCMHAHCVDQDRIYMLNLMLKNGRLKVEDLTDPKFLINAEPPAITEWVDPLDIFGDASLSGSPELPPGVLPAVLEAFAVDKAQRLGVDPSMIALPALAVCAASLDDFYQIQPRVHDHEWTESARLWVAVIEEAGGKKTPAINAAIAPLNRIEARWAEADELTKDERDREIKVYEAKLKKYVAATAKGESQTPPESPPEYFARRRVVSDTTVEALSDILRGNPSGVLAYNDELAGWIGSFDTYKASGKGAGRDRALWLELYNGGQKPIDRVSRGRILVPNWSASIVGGIQPGPIKKLVGNLSDDGLLQRFIVIHGKQAGAGVDRPPNEVVMQGYRDCIERLVAAHTEAPVKTRFSPEAQIEREQVIRAADALKLLPDTSPAFRAHLSKWEALFARLALTFHAVETIGTVGGGITKAIPGGTAARVAQFMVDFLLPNAARFYSETFGTEGQIEHARWVAGYILSRALAKISARDIGRAYRTLRGDSPSLQAAMDTLVTAGWVEPVNPDRFRKAKGWVVNPAVHERFANEAEMEKQRRENERAKIREATQTLGIGEVA